MTLNKKLKIAQYVLTAAGALIVGAATTHVSKEERKGKMLEILADYAKKTKPEESEGPKEDGEI